MPLKDTPWGQMRQARSAQHTTGNVPRPPKPAYLPPPPPTCSVSPLPTAVSTIGHKCEITAVVYERVITPLEQQNGHENANETNQDLIATDTNNHTAAAADISEESFEEEEDEEDYEYEDELEKELEASSSKFDQDDIVVEVTLPVKIEVEETEEESSEEESSDDSDDTSSCDMQPEIVEVTDLKECEGLATVDEFTVDEVDDEEDEELQDELEQDEGQNGLQKTHSGTASQIHLDDGNQNGIEHDENGIEQLEEEEEQNGLDQPDKNPDQADHADVIENGKELVVENNFADNSCDKAKIPKHIMAPKIPPFVKSEPPCDFHDDPSTWIEWLETEVNKFKQEQLAKKQKADEEAKLAREQAEEAARKAQEELAEQTRIAEELAEQSRIAEENEKLAQERAELDRTAREQALSQEVEEEAEYAIDCNHEKVNGQEEEALPVIKEIHNIPESSEAAEEKPDPEINDDREQQSDDKEDEVIAEENAKEKSNEDEWVESSQDEKVHLEMHQKEEANLEQAVECLEEEDLLVIEKCKQILETKTSEQSSEQSIDQDKHLADQEEEKDSVAESLNASKPSQQRKRVVRSSERDSDPMEVIEKMRQMRQNRVLQRHASADNTNGTCTPPPFMRVHSNPDARIRSRPSSIVNANEDGLDDMLVRVKKLREERQQILKDMAMLKDAFNEQEPEQQPEDNEAQSSKHPNFQNLILFCNDPSLVNLDEDDQVAKLDRTRLSSFDSGIGKSVTSTCEGSSEPVQTTRKVSHQSSQSDTDVIYCFICDEELGKLTKGAVMHMGLEDGEPICPEALNLTEKSKQKIKNIALTKHLDLRAKYEFLETLDLDLVTGEDYEFTSEDVLQKVEDFLDHMEHQKRKDQEQFDLLRTGAINEIYAELFAEDMNENNHEECDIETNATSTADYMNDSTDEAIFSQEEDNSNNNAFQAVIPAPPAPPPAPAPDHLKEARSELLSSIKQGRPKLKSAQTDDKSQPAEVGKVLHKHLAPRVFTKGIRDLMHEIQAVDAKKKLKKTKTIDKSKPYIPQDIEIYFYAGPNADKSLAPPPKSRDLPNKKSPSPPSKW